MEASTCNHWRSGKATSITYPECVSVALVIQHAKRMRRIILWSVQMYRIFPHYLIDGIIFGGKKFMEQKRVLIFFTTMASNISHPKYISAKYYHQCM